MESLSEELKENNKHIAVKEKQIEQAQTVQNFKLCDQLSSEVTALKEKWRDLELSLHVLRRKEQRSKKYFAQKASSTTTPEPCTASSEVDITQEATPLGDTPYETTSSNTSFL